MGTLIQLDDPAVRPVLPVLLQDRTMKRNIIWATGSYAALGEYYRDSGQITAIALQKMGRDSIQPRILKAQEEQQQRTRKHGEVQTPAWLCCRMNDHLDEAWFERENVFVTRDGQAWTPVEGKIAFPKHRHSGWRQYVDSRRLEITCGEAPFIVSRYDAATGEPIPIGRRIGLLDRKLRIVGENTDSEAEWVKWAIRAIESVYGYEYQGDNLLIARINVLMTFVEYLQSAWHRAPTEKELATVAKVISWNFWQMDGLTGTVPRGKLQAPEQEAQPITMEELGWFAAIDAATPPERPQEQSTTPPCRICNWRQAHTVTFDSLKTHRGRDVRNMKFDYVIGNPPYQDEQISNDTDDSKKNYAPPVYDKFMEAAFAVSDYVELIHPARFLFNAGSTPKAWNQKMLEDEHFKILMYEEDGSKIFPSLSTPLRGGVTISCRNKRANYGAILAFTKYQEVNNILHKVTSSSTYSSLMDIVYSRTSYRLTDIMHEENPFAIHRVSKGHAYDMSSNIMSLIPEIFLDNKPQDQKEYISILGRIGNRRLYKYIRRDYVKHVDNLDYYKVYVAQANGSGEFGDTLSEPVVEKPGVGATETFLSIGKLNTEKEALALQKYIKTKFARTMLSVLKVTQNGNKPVWKYVPLQDFTPASDIDWSQPIPDIDRQLYRKYGLTDEEIAFIESHVKEMT